MINIKENPYSSILEIMQNQGSKHNPPSIKIGTVLYIEETDTEVLDIKIQVDDLPIDKKNIYISDTFLKEDVREYKTSSDKTIWSDTNYIKNVDTLKKGDSIAVMPVKGGQSYIILARVRRID